MKLSANALIDNLCRRSFGGTASMLLAASGLLPDCL